MKISVKCFELTNKGNGKKCKLGPLLNYSRHQDCPFKTNGMMESSIAEVKIAYISSLAKRCKEWHTRKKKIDHYYLEIEPQIDAICTNIKQTECLQVKKLAKK